MDKQTEAVVRTTIYLKIVDSEKGCVPDFHLVAVAVEDARKAVEKAEKSLTNP